MAVIIVGAEKNLAELAPRLLGGAAEPALTGEIAAAIAAANPHADLDALTPGTLLTLPDLPSLSVGAAVRLDSASRKAGAGLVDAGSAALDGLVAAAARVEQEAGARRKLLGAALAEAEAAMAAHADPAVAAGIAAARERIALADAGVEERMATLQEARAQWAGELEALRKLLL
jgi:hypothetical protein